MKIFPGPSSNQKNNHKQIHSTKEKVQPTGGKAVVAIKHILQTMSLLILAAIDAPKTVSMLIERYLVNFLWEERTENEVSLEPIKNLASRSVEEGRMGFRNLEDVCNIYAMKRW